MITYQINILTENGEIQEKFVKTDANKMDVQKAIDFVSHGEKNVSNLLTALRMLGFTAREVKVEAEEVFDM